MVPDRKKLLTIVLAALAGLAGVALGQAGGGPLAAEAGPQSKGFLDFIRAGGWVGYTIIALSFVGVGLVIDSLLHTRTERLIPPGLVEQADKLAHRGRFAEMTTLCQAGENFICRIIRKGLGEGALGLPAVRQAMQEQGGKELTRLRHRVGYVGFIASVAPMLGLLGTVTGMIRSFNILGASKGAARPDELAVGIAEALVTTCEGLIVAIPLMFLHRYLADRVTRIGQEASGTCERLLRVMAVAIEARSATRSVESAQQGAAKTT